MLRAPASAAERDARAAVDRAASVLRRVIIATFMFFLKLV